jgi:hypothetical protein
MGGVKKPGSLYLLRRGSREQIEPTKKQQYEDTAPQEVIAWTLR